MYAEDSIFVEDLERNICVAQELRKELSDIFVRIEAFHSDLPKEFGTFPHQSEIDSEENVINDTTYNEVYLAKRTPKYYKKFEEIELVGTEVSYRCAKCRGVLIV